MLLDVVVVVVGGGTLQQQWVMLSEVNVKL